MSIDQTFIREIECVDNERLRIHQLYIGDVGCVVWDAALVLCRFLSHSKYFPHSYWKGKKVIELGSGTGAVGLTAGVLGANVTVTDRPYCIALMQRNIDDNGTALLLRNGKVLAKTLEWGQDVSSFHPLPDIILMADLIYYDEVTDKLVDTVKKLSSQDTYIIMSYEVRTTGNKPEIVAKFFQLMSLHFLNHEVEYNDLDEDCRSEDIKIFILKLKQ